MNIGFFVLSIPMYKCIVYTDRCLISIVNKTGEKQFNLNLSKNKPCTFMHKYATIHSQKVQNAMSSV